MRPRAYRFLPSSVLLLLLLLLTFAALPALAGVDRFTPAGPMNGRLRALAVDPQAPGSLLAAPSLTGIYRSDDGGHAWAWSGAGLGQEAIQAIAADPANPGTIYAIAVTQAFRSTDGGHHWVAVTSGQNFSAGFNSDPTGPRYAALALLSGGPGALPVLLVGSAQSLQRSADGGATWTTVYTVDSPNPSFSIWSLAVDPTIPTAPRRVFAGFTTGSGGTLLESTDGGQTWAPLPNLPNPPHGILALLALPTSPVTLLASTTRDTQEAALFQSTDLGASWVEVSLSSSSQPSVTALAYEPQTPSIVYAATFRNLFVSLDAGDSWTPRGAGLTPFGINLLVAAPGTRTVYAVAGNDLEKSLDRGRHWSIAAQSGFDFSAPLERPALALRFSPGEPAHLYAILDGEGFESTNGGATWTSFATDRAPLYNTRPRDLQIDPGNPNVLYGLTASTLYRSTDRGATWAALSSPPGQGEGGFTHLLLLGRKTVLVTDFSVARSLDGGHTWTRAAFCGSATEGDFEGRRIDRLLFDPRQPSVLYAGVTDVFGRHPPIPFPETCKSLDGGATWKQLIPDSAVLALDPSRVGRLYVSRPAGLQRSDDGGRTFHTLSSFGAAPFVVTGTYVSDLLVDPATPTTLYAGTRDRGVWRSLDGGVHWEAVNAGLARYTDLQTYQLVLQPAIPHLLYAEVDGWVFQNGFTEP